MANTPSDGKKSGSSGGGGGGDAAAAQSGSSKGAKPSPMPKDAQVMAAVLKDMGVAEYEPRVLSQLLEFSYRYVTNVLDDARALSAHAAKKTGVDLDDVKLAAQMYAEQNLTSPPSRDLLLEMSGGKNAAPLPVPKSTCGLRLPPERHCLTAVNYRIKLKAKSRPPGYGGVGVGGRGGYGMVPPRMVGAPGGGGGVALGKPPVVGGLPGMGPKPMIKVAQAGPAGIANIQITPQQPMNAPQPMFKISVNPQDLQQQSAVSVKRKAEDMS